MELARVVSDIIGRCADPLIGQFTIILFQISLDVVRTSHITALGK